MIQQKDPGLGTKFTKKVNRLVNEDGSYNIIRRGGMRGLKDLYKFLIDIHWLLFIILFFGFYLLINTLFALLYLWIGMDQLQGINYNDSHFLQALFFSFQTFTTVGYGSISPLGYGAQFLASLEAFLGLLSFAIATGLLYGRVSMPSSKIRFSKNIIITPFEDGKALMFKMVNERDNILLNSKVETLFIMNASNDAKNFNKLYFKLKLETDFVNFFPLTWTLVHKIDDDSPLNNISLSELKQRSAEVVVLVESFDDTFGQIVFSKHSYAEDQWMENVKFVRNYETNDFGQVELYINELDTLEKI